MTSHWIRNLLVALALIGVSAPAMAREEIPLKAGKVWKHKHTGIGVPASLGGITRKQGIAYAADDLDTGFSFSLDDDAESVTFYIFRNTNGAVPVWFAQAQWGIENRSNLGNSEIVVAPQAFAPPGQRTVSGLKAIYRPGKMPYLSTGVMMLPIGDWYVKLRASSTTRSPAELEQWMNAILAEIKWPKKIADGPAAKPVENCAAMLSFPEAAKDAEKDGAADLLSGMLGMMASTKQVKPTPESKAALANARWCRDASGDGNISAYRRDEDKQRYLLALGDNGNGIWVSPDEGAAMLAAAENDPAKVKPQRYQIVMMTALENINYVAQDRMPSPQRVIELVNSNRRVTTVPTWGKNKNITFNSNEF